MRRIVRDYIAAAVDRAKPQIEQFIAKHLPTGSSTSFDIPSFDHGPSPATRH